MLKATPNETLAPVYPRQQKACGQAGSVLCITMNLIKLMNHLATPMSADMPCLHTTTCTSHLFGVTTNTKGIDPARQNRMIIGYMGLLAGSGASYRTIKDKIGLRCSGSLERHFQNLGSQSSSTGPQVAISLPLE